MPSTVGIGVFAEYSCIPALCLDHGAIPPCNSCALRSHSCGHLFVHDPEWYSGIPFVHTRWSCAQRWLAELCSCYSVLSFGAFAEYFIATNCQLYIIFGANSPSHNRKIASTINLSCIFHKKVVSLHPKWFTLGNVGGIMSAFRPRNNLSRHH